VRSIRANLVLWLAAALALGSAALLAATYFFARAQLDRVFDEELRQVARAVHLREDWREQGTIRVAREDFVYAVRAYDEKGRLFFETLLPAHPFEAPRSFVAGFTEVESYGEAWRVYTHVTPEGVVQVAQPEVSRVLLARELALQMSIPVLLFIPLVVALVVGVLSRGLAPLTETSGRVRDRDAARLDPLPLEGVPRELAPLVGQINALLARLGASIEMQRGFFADAAHELRSPIAALALQAQLAARAPEGPARASAFDELRQGIERASRLVQQLLDLARLEPGQQSEPHAPVDVAELARSVVGSFAAQAEALGVDLGADAPGPAVVSGAAAELRSLIANLLDNALRYAPRESQVTVSVREDPAGVDLAVLDAGPGIPADERERVFKRFHRLPGDQTRGSGLGLPIARAIVQRHGGSIALADARPGAEPPGLAVRVRLDR